MNAVSATFHAVGLLGLVPMLLLAYIGNAAGAITCMVLIFVLHGLGIISDNEV